MNAASNLWVPYAMGLDRVKSTRRRPLGRRWHRWEENIKMDHKEMCHYEELL